MQILIGKLLQPLKDKVYKWDVMCINAALVLVRVNYQLSIYFSMSVAYDVCCFIRVTYCTVTKWAYICSSFLPFLILPFPFLSCPALPYPILCYSAYSVLYYAILISMFLSLCQLYLQLFAKWHWRITRTSDNEKCWEHHFRHRQQHYEYAEH